MVEGFRWVGLLVLVLLVLVVVGRRHGDERAAAAGLVLSGCWVVEECGGTNPAVRCVFV